MAEENPATQRQTAVTAYLQSKQLLLFVFYICMDDLVRKNLLRVEFQLGC